MAESTIRAVPEGFALQTMLTTAPAQLGLTPDEAAGLLAGVRTAYTAMAADPLFAGVPSALPGCFSQQPDRPAQYFLYRPAQLTRQTPTIVWLHGFGGNFLFYAWVLQAAFPDHVLVIPSFGLSWQHGSATHLDDVLADAARQLGQPLGRPWLMAISAGGPAAFQLYADRPATFRGLLAIATAPGPGPLPELPPASRILMVNGTRDRGFPVGLVHERATLLEQQFPGFRYRELPSDHYFLLTQREATIALLRQFMTAQMPRQLIPATP
jgi:pimeloyl-ACP methyl ester carboxylesterase